MLVWVAWSERQDGMDEYTEFIRFLSRKIGARFIRFYTVRKGFVRAGKKYGWQHVGAAIGAGYCTGGTSFDIYPTTSEEVTDLETYCMNHLKTVVLPSIDQNVVITE